MSEARAELERLQARLRELELLGVSDLQLELVAVQLEREAEAWAQWLDRAEQKALRAENPGTGARVLGFGFSLLVLAPIVAMVGVSGSRLLTHEPELAVAVLLLGLLVVTFTAWGRTRRLVWRRLSRAWRLIRAARATSLSLRAGRGQGEGPS